MGPTLKIERLSGEGGSPVETVMDVTMGAEVNVGGRIINGGQWKPTVEGWYRMTYTITGNVTLTSVGNTETTYQPVLKGNKASTLDVYIKP